MNAAERIPHIARLRARIAELEAADDVWRRMTREAEDRAEQAEEALDSFLGPDGGKTVVELRATIERLKVCGNCLHDRGIDDICDDCTVDESRWTADEDPT